MQINNEVFFAIIYIIMLLFSDWTGAEVKKNYAWAYVSTKSVMALINIVIAIWFAVKMFLLFPVKLKNLMNFYCRKLGLKLFGLEDT